ncbi:metallophosphoesterase family protein [Profundibacter sp.]|uniref:metallophosphoesterase family protein n=1 Tax=Profundibacter sp. TaxID=3101071 RepID=UPI003D0A245A
MFRFIHTADLHLDAPLHSLALKDEVLSDLVGSATRGALEQIVTLCLEEDVHALLIAGDLYDRDLHSMKTAAFLTAQLERLNAAEIPVFIIRGNHDAASVITKELDLPPNVHVFSGHGGTKQLEEYGVAVHGVSFAKPQAPESLLPKYPAPVAGCFNIGLLHTSLAGSEGHDTYAPCSVSDLKNHGYDYWALGHIHKRQVHSEAPHIVMPGMPQGRDIGEAGTKTVTMVSVSDGPGSNNVTLEERRTSQVEFNRVSCALDGVEEWRDMLAQITAAITEAVSQAAGNSILRVDLTGQTPLAWRVRRDMDLLSEQIREAAQFIGTVWIEKVECHLRQPEASEAREDPRFELQALMQTLMQEESVTARAVEMAEWLVGELPPEIRPGFGADRDALAASVTTFLTEGCEDVVAMMMGEETEGDR